MYWFFCNYLAAENADFADLTLRKIQAKSAFSAAK
jgi:hypothetical protein